MREEAGAKVLTRLRKIALESGRPRERKEKLDELMEVFSRFGRVRP